MKIDTDTDFDDKINSDYFPLTRHSDILEAALDEFEPGLELVREQPESQSRDEIKG